MSVTLATRLEFLEGAVDAQFDDESVAFKEARGWCTNNSDFEAYCVDLAFPGHPDGLAGMVESAIGRNPNNVGLDIAGGSDGVALQDLLRDGILGTAIVTNYQDRRSEQTRQNPRLHHVEGDLVSGEPWQKILQLQERYAPDGLALVMHRPVGGLQYLPAETYRGATHLLLDITRPGGLLFLQIPDALLPQRNPGVLETIHRSIRRRGDVQTFIPSIVPRFTSLPVIDSVVMIKKS